MPRTFAHHAQEGEGIEKGRQGKEGRLLLLLPQQSKKKKKSINSILKMKKGKRHSTLTQSGHKTQSWFEPSVNHKTNLRLKLKKKKEQNEEQWGSPSFVCELAWLGFSTCISLLLFLFFHSFEAGGWQKHQSLQAHCVACILWHTPLAGSIQYNHTFLFSPRCCTNEYRLKRELQDKCALLLCAFVVIMFWLD